MRDPLCMRDHPYVWGYKDHPFFYEGPPLKGTTLMYEGTTFMYEGPPFFYRHFACSLSLSFLMKEPYMKDHLSFETTLTIKQK